MNLVLNRFTDKTEEFTDGVLHTSGVYFCDTLEDPVRDLNKDGDLNDPGEGKIYGDTAIPFGNYEVVISWSPKFKKFMPLITGVNGFSGIRIHGGRTKKDTLGCLLVGHRRIDRGRLEDGLETSKRLTNFLIDMCVEKDESGASIEYVDKTYGRAYKLKDQIFIKII